MLEGTRGDRWEAIAAAQAREGDFTEALATAAGQPPATKLRALCHVARAQAMQGLPAEALRTLEGALPMAPQAPDFNHRRWVLKMLGETHVALGRLEALQVWAFGLQEPLERMWACLGAAAELTAQRAEGP